MKTCISSFRSFQGFSLFELLIVIAIMGILATLAFPLYSDYLIRARILELFSAVQPAKLAIAENILGGIELEKIDTVQAGISFVPYGTVQDLKVMHGHIIVTGNNKKLGIVVSSPLQVVFKPVLRSDSNISWECGLPENAPVEFNKYLPSHCRQNLKIE